MLVPYFITITINVAPFKIYNDLKNIKNINEINKIILNKYFK